MSANSVLPCGIGFGGFGSGHVCGLPAGHEGPHRALDIPPPSDTPTSLPLPVAIEKAFADTITEHHYLRGDATDKTRSFLIGVATTLFRIDNGRRVTDDEETELQRMLDEWVRS